MASNVNLALAENVNALTDDIRSAYMNGNAGISDEAGEIFNIWLQKIKDAARAEAITEVTNKLMGRATELNGQSDTDFWGGMIHGLEVAGTIAYRMNPSDQ